MPRIRENRVPRIREIGSLQVHTGYLTFFFKKAWFNQKILQQYFHPSAKFLLYKQARNQGGHLGAVLPNIIVPRKICLLTVKTKIFFP